MGTIINNTVIVHLSDPDAQCPLIKAWLRERNLTDSKMFMFGPVVCNNYQTIIMVTDGGKFGGGIAGPWAQIRQEFVQMVAKIPGHKEIFRINHGEIDEPNLFSYEVLITTNPLLPAKRDDSTGQG